MEQEKFEEIMGELRSTQEQLKNDRARREAMKSNVTYNNANYEI